MLQVKTYLQFDLEGLLTNWSMGIEQLKIVWSTDLISNSLWIGAKNSFKLVTSLESNWTSRKFKSDQESFLLYWNSIQKFTNLIQH